MRILTVIALLAATALAGCLDNNDLDTYSAPDVDPEQKVMPERTFEPVVTLDINYFEFEPGDNVVVTWDVSDLHDYPFPLTFIDWTIKYSGAPNFVAEGDATQLPGSYERIIYAEGFYRFTLDISDNQDLDESHDIIIKVGDPVIEEVVEEVEEVVDGYPQDRILSAPLDCFSCVDASTDAHGAPATGYPGAKGCSGFMEGINYRDCAWVNILPASWGKEFSVSSTMRADGDGFLSGKVEGDPGSVDVEFLDSCKSSANSVTQEFIVPSFDPQIVEGVIPEGARCMVAFEYLWPTGDGVDFHFQWNERTDEPLDDPWFDESGFFRAGRTIWYDGVLMTPDADSGCIGNTANCGPSACPGLASGANGHGCAWIEVTPNLWGQRFSITSHADHDGFSLTSCSPDADVIETYGQVGPETWGTTGYAIPENAGCIMVSDWAGQSTMVTFEIVSPP